MEDRAFYFPRMHHPGRFRFWQRWLFFSSLIFAAFGAEFALFGDRFPLTIYNHLVARRLWAAEGFPPEAEVYREFISGPFGGTIACCYILLAFIAWYPFQERQTWARNAIMAAFGTWVVIDSALCIRFGVHFQIYAINAFSILVKALPIIFTWNDFERPLTKPVGEAITFPVA